MAIAPVTHVSTARNVRNVMTVARLRQSKTQATDAVAAPTQRNSRVVVLVERLQPFIPTGLFPGVLPKATFPSQAGPVQRHFRHTMGVVGGRDECAFSDALHRIEAGPLVSPRRLSGETSGRHRIMLI